MRTEESEQVEPTFPTPQNSSVILFYDDVTVFGGHEKMALCLIAQFLRFTRYSVVFVFSDKNQRLAAELDALQRQYPDRISVVPVPITSGQMPTLEMVWQFPQLISLFLLLKQIAPAFAIIVQGNIELSVKGLVAAWAAGIPAVSYLPAVFHFKDIPGPPLARVRDFCNKVLFRVADAFIVISQRFKDLLQNEGRHSEDLFLIRNLIDTERLFTEDRAQARDELELPQTPTIVTIIGRIYFDGKGQDLALNALSSLLDENLRLLIVGDGPDFERLIKLATLQIAEGKVIVKNWVDNPSLIYSASDLILMPSMLEGMPLVLLESLYLGKPIVASDIPPFDEYLLPERRFKPNDTKSLRQCVVNAVEGIRTGLLTTAADSSITFDSDINRQNILRLVSFMERKSGRVPNA